MKHNISFTRINNDVNGNPRYVCHFLNLLKDEDNNNTIDSKYQIAINRARTIGGKKFHNRQYGGGIVFQSYNLENTAFDILEVTGQLIEYWRNPTQAEIEYGNGAIHRKHFLKTDVKKANGDFKKWFICPKDKLRYNLI